MQKHQITLAGGQIVPLYLGAVEKEPDVLHVLYTRETEKVCRILTDSLKTITVEGYLVDGFNYTSTYTTVQSIIKKHSAASWELNVTGGTKIMALAAHEFFIHKNLPVFYIRQDNTIYDFKSKESSYISRSISLQTFVSLSGYTCSGTDVSSIPRQEFEFSRMISKIAATKQFGVLMKRYQMQYGGHVVNHDFLFSESKQRAEWNHKVKALSIRLIPHEKDLFLQSENAIRIAFIGGWWELVVLDALRKCPRIREINFQVNIQSIEHPERHINEIDILANLGHRLAFVECKSGYIKQEDINKMHAVRENYGGSVASSLLVSRYALEKDIEEKCKKLQIDYLVLSKRKIDPYIMTQELNKYMNNAAQRPIV